MYTKKILFIIFILVFLLVLNGCSSITCAEREAHYVNSKRYIPMLKVYIKNDDSLHDNLKETYELALDEWWNLIDAKYKECIKKE